MARIAFIQNTWADILGPMHISASLKKDGHVSEIIVEHGSVKRLIDDVVRFSPDIVCFYCTTGLHMWGLNRANTIKQANKNILIAFGGPHSTYSPEIIYHPSVDVVCRGEGEDAMLELAEAVTSKEIQLRTNIRNLWLKFEQAIVKNEVRPPIKDLNQLPFPDRSYYEKYSHFKRTGVRSFITARGCPYNCSYCSNDKLIDLYRGMGKFVRHRDPENMIDEILYVKNKYGIKTVNFYDDTFIFDRKWLETFLEKYKERVNTPFHCNVRADLVNNEVIKSLKNAGCQTVAFGIESGNGEIRNRVLNKRISDEQIINTGRILKEYGVKFKTYNMVGLPGEKLSDAFQTVALNIKIGTDFPWCSIYTPYPETELAQYAIKRGYLGPNFDADKIPTLYLSKSLLEQEDISNIVNLQKFFHIAVKAPFTIPVIKLLIKLPQNKFFNFIYYIGYAYSQILKLYKMRFGDFLSTIFHSMKLKK